MRLSNKVCGIWLLAPLMFVFVTGCTEVRYSDPNQQKIAKLVHDYIFRYEDDYQRISGTKALAACIEWPKPGSQTIFIDTYGYMYTADQSGRQIPISDISDGALQNCNGSRSHGEFSCTCSIIDIGSSITVDIPENMTGQSYRVRSRKSKKPWPERRSTEVRGRSDEDIKDHKENCRPSGQSCG